MAGAGACIVLEQHRAHFRDIHRTSFLFSPTQISGSILLIHSEDIRLFSFKVKQYHFTTKHLKVMKLFNSSCLNLGLVWDSASQEVARLTYFIMGPAATDGSRMEDKLIE